MKRLFVLVLALFCLTSCASMLEREETYTNPHVENPPSSLSDAYRVNTYSGLRSALETYVEEGMTEGNLRFPATYPGNLTVDLEKAKRQLMEEDPLGCYAVEDVTFHINRIIAYYEVTAAFDYKVDPAEYMTLETVKAGSALEEKMAAALRDFGSGFTVIVDIPEPWGVEDFIANGLYQAYNANPDVALGYPELELTLYPEEQRRAVAKVKLTYPESTTVLRLRQKNLLHAAEEFADTVEPDAFVLRDALLERCTYDPEGGGTAADVFLNGTASDEGLARAFALVCDLKGIENSGPEMGKEENGWFCMAEAGDGSMPFGFLPYEPQTAVRAGEEEAP